MTKQLFDKEKSAKEAVEEVREVNGDFQKLMQQDVVLDTKIQEVLARDSGRCDGLSDEQKAEYVNYLCSKVGIDPTFRPIDIIATKNGLKPYLNKGAGEIIRDTRKISIDDMQIKEVNNMWVATCRVKSLDGRIDTDVGVCPKTGTQKSPMAPNDSLMKAVTKAKRRATLSMCGLGAIIEETHPTEYNGEPEQQECRSQILLEDEPSTKNYFAAVIKSKIDTKGLELPKEVLSSLCEQAKILAHSDKIEDAAKWLQDNGKIDYTVNEEVDLIMNAVIKEDKNGS